MGRYYSIPQPTSGVSPQLNLGRGGDTLHVINHPYLDYTNTELTTPGPALAGIFLFVGFDKVPTESQHDFVLPPFSDVTLSVPPDVRNVILVAPASTLPGLTVAPSGPVSVWIEWLPCVVPTGVNFPLLGAAPIAASALGLNMQPPVDRHGWRYQPQLQFPVLDQAWNGGYLKHARPKIGPSASDSAHAVLVAGTLTTWLATSANDFLDSTGNASRILVLQRLIVSSTLAGLFVIGTNGLTIGSPGAQEVARATLVAGVPFVFDFGEGIQIDTYGAVGTWKYYHAAASTVDITAIGG